MRNGKYFIKSLAMSCALLVLGVFGAPVCYALRPPQVTNVASLDQLVQWYRLPEARLAMLTSDIEITQSLELGQTTSTKGVQACNMVTGSNHTLRVMSGVTLVVNNPSLTLEGVKEIITVEKGGTLQLNRGRLYAGTEDNKNVVAIVVKEGGDITVASGFELMNGVIKDENIVLPPDNSSPPPSVDTRTPITSLFDDKAHISCVVGERPDPSQYLATVYAYFGQTDRTELAVSWELAAVDFDKAGTYTVVGKLTDAAMQKHNLSNPKGLTATMTITVYKKGAVDNVRSEVLSVGSSGNTVARLILPALPTDKISAIYLYSSADGVLWEKSAYHTLPDGTVKEESYLSATQTVGSSSYIVYKYVTSYRALWVRVEIVGSDRAGMSNAVQLILPSGAAPGDNTQNDSSEDAGDSGGNRGGVGQEETDRVLPPEDEAAKNAGYTASSQPDGAAVASSQADNPSQMPDDAPDEIPESSLEEASSQQAVTVMGEGAAEPAKPAIPGAVTAAVCTVGVIAAASVLLKCNWQAVLKLIQRKS